MLAEQAAMFSLLQHCQNTYLHIRSNVILAGTVAPTACARCTNVVSPVVAVVAVVAVVVIGIAVTTVARLEGLFFHCCFVL